VKRGEVWWADSPSASEPGFRRPVLVLQSDEFTRSRINTVVVAVITSNVRLAAAPGNVSLPKRGAGLNRESVINVSQILTLDKSFLVEKTGKLSQVSMSEVDEGVRLVLEL